MHTRFAVLLVLLLTAATATSADNSQNNAAIKGLPCPDLPLSNGSPATQTASAQDTPCPPLPLANLRSQGSSAEPQGNSATTTSTIATTSQGNSEATTSTVTSQGTSLNQGGNAEAPGVVRPASEASLNALNQPLGQVKEDLAFTDLQQNTTVSCTPVSVKGDATYCVSGRVCSGPGSTLPGTNCPKRGDVAIASCLSVFTSYSDASNNCVAKQNAQCVAIETGVWGCVFPDVAHLPLAEQEVASDWGGELTSTLVTDEKPATSIKTEHASTLELPPVDGGNDERDFTGYEADIASELYSGSAETATTFTANPNSAAAGMAGLNVVVAVAALVMAAVGVAAVRKRQNNRRLDRTRNNSTQNLSCMELSTPI